MATQFVTCPRCSAQNTGLNSTCTQCGLMLPFTPAAMPMQHAPNAANLPGSEKKVLAGVLGILFGGLGVHKFVLGYTNEGIIMLVTYIAGILLCGIPSVVIAIIGIAEGIIYLTKSDEEFVQTYIQYKKPWF